MWWRQLTGIFTVLLLGISAAGQNDGTISVSVNLVKVPVTIFDEHGAAVQDLRREDFVLYEDGNIQQIRSFGVDRNTLSVILLIDTSATVEKELKKIKEAALAFADALSREDRISVITFDDGVTLLQDWTNSTKDVKKSLGKIEPGLRTALYDAMFMAAHDQLRGIEGRKAIVLLTDCLNNQSSLSFKDAAVSVIQSQASLYVVSKTVIVREAARHQRRVVMLSDIYKRMFGGADYVDEFFKRREREMVELADSTGGRCFFPADYDHVKGAYSEIADELRNKHFLTYVSNRRNPPNTYHRITLEYLQPFSKISYRQGYYFQPAPIHKKSYWLGRTAPQTRTPDSRR